MDLFSRKVIAWNISAKPDVDLVMTAFKKAYDICEIADPDDVWTSLVELLMQVIGAFAITFMAIITERFFRGHAW